MVKTDLIEIAYDLTFSTLFHCGTGIRAGLVDRTVIRDDAGYLYVPGSTFKGVLREHCEQLARFYSHDADKKWIASPHDAEAALQGLGHRPPTMVTRIFGSQNSPGRLFFDDARQSTDDKEQYERPASAGEQHKTQMDRRNHQSLQVDLYTQVRLDRITHTAVPGALYTSEFGGKDMTFKGSITGWLACTVVEVAALQNVHHPDETPTYSLLLLLAGLRMVERLGGNKSTGKGHCTCEITEVKIKGHTLVKEEWKSWLGQLDELVHYHKAQEV